MPHVETDITHVYRDTTTRALLNKDKSSLIKSRIIRATTQQASQRQLEAEKRMQLMGERLDRCEHLLHELVQHVSALVAKLPSSDKETEMRD